MKKKSFFASMIALALATAAKFSPETVTSKPYLRGQQPTRSRRSRWGVSENERARRAGIPKHLRQYAKRYAGLDTEAILQIHKQAAQEGAK